MASTRICLTEQQRNALAAIAGRAGRKQSELIREAIDRHITHMSREHRKRKAAMKRDEFRR